MSIRNTKSNLLDIVNPVVNKILKYSKEKGDMNDF